MKEKRTVHKRVVDIEPLASREDPAVIGVQRFIVMLGAGTELPESRPDSEQEEYSPQHLFHGECVGQALCPC